MTDSVFRKRWESWNPVSTIYGRDGEHWTPYQTRVKLTPKTPWGQLMLHIFWRGDADPDCHDHPWDFWTFPFRSYKEEVLVPLGRSSMLVDSAPIFGYLGARVVSAFRWHHRPAEYRHRVLSDENGKTFVTLVWKGKSRRKWGFWVSIAGTEHDGFKHVPWREYVYGQS